MAFEFKFSADQPHQKAAVDGVLELFEGFSASHVEGTILDEVFPNLPDAEMLDEEWLAENLGFVQGQHNTQYPAAPVPMRGLEMGAEADGMMLDGVSNDSHRAPHFTVEMETGTGKTYVYFRSMHELYRRHGFRKFIIVVPSVAIMEGVKKSFEITRKHFEELYGVTNFRLIEYDGARLGQLRNFAQSQTPVVMVMTMQSFNTANRNFYKPTEKLAGARLPYQWVQETRPIVILDEPQNMGSEKAREAIRTLKPLFVLRYSATHCPGETPNTVYRLTPLEAFRQGLVKQIEVVGISDLSGLNVPQFRIEEITRNPITAKVKTLVMQDGVSTEQLVTLKSGDDLFRKTKNPDHQGFVVESIGVAKDDLPGFVRFENGEEFGTGDEVIGSRTEIWRAQIRETIQTHFERQRQLRAKGVKVLSLFFIDRVANYQGQPGTIRKLFEEEYAKLQPLHTDGPVLDARDVHRGYFASKKVKDREVVSDELQKADSDEAKETFKLIMREKERLLSFEEPVSFIFAHSALKEGWDNPNVFQICTLNQTVSSTKKRQEIGRGLRLCVDQDGNRPEGFNLNILTVIANESYESYVANLQQNYADDGEGAPPPPKKPSQAVARRRDELFQGEAFQAFWQKLCKRLAYRIEVDTDVLVDEAVAALKTAKFPQPVMTVSRGQFIVRQYEVRLEKVIGEAAVLQIHTRDSRAESQPSLGLTSASTSQQQVVLHEKQDLSTKFPVGDARRQHFRKWKLQRVWEQYGEARIKFDNEVEVSPSEPYRFEVQVTLAKAPVTVLAEAHAQPIPDFIGRAAGETDLTRATLIRIFQSLPDDVKEKLLINPEGWTNVFVATLHDVLADHVARRVEYFGETSDIGPAEEFFGAEVKQPQRELIEDQTGKALYDRVQIDSDVERTFVEQSLRSDGDHIAVYFKFPPKFKLGLPRVIGNYNPDWGVVRLAGEHTRVELVRETKGSENEATLRFASEKRKILAARRYFKALGIDYRVVTGETERYWDAEGTSATGAPGLFGGAGG
ncbi:DEAD/DEAH box helicase family protein [uncultured Deinococcus sp.]|uniref:restriction endonuclease n=1 Tax=uncultured Deinococcus sp. TaxID=158789 RepID=UPI0025D704F1|nr:DEAD/DEAH box helicase family protein [uncultured Deinococcus sp.]